MFSRFLHGSTRRHIFRDRRPFTTACSLSKLLGDRDAKIEIVYCTMKKKLFCTGLTRAAKADISLLYRQNVPNEPLKESPFYLYSSSPHSPQFKQSVRATPFLVSCGFTFLYGVNTYKPNISVALLHRFTSMLNCAKLSLENLQKIARNLEICFCWQIS